MYPRLLATPWEGIMAALTLSLPPKSRSSIRSWLPHFLRCQRFPQRLGFPWKYNNPWLQLHPLTEAMLLLFSHWVVSDSVTPWTVTHQAPLSMGFPRQLEWVDITFSRGSSWPRDQTCMSCFGRQIPCHWATGEIDKAIERKESEVAQSCLTLCEPMDCSLPGSSVHGIFQARVREWVAISFSRGSSQPRDQTRISRTAGRRFTVWATRA